MKVAFRVSAPDVMPAVSSPYRVLADIYRFRDDGAELYGAGVPLTVSASGRTTDPLELPPGSYQFNVNLGNGRSGIATVDEDDVVAKSGVTISDISVIGSDGKRVPDTTSKPDKRQRTDASFDAFRLLGELAVPSLAMDGPPALATSTQRRFSVDVVSVSDVRILDMLGQSECSERDLASAYLGRVETVYSGAARRTHPFPTYRKNVVGSFALAGGKDKSEFAPSAMRRASVLTIGRDSFERITYRPSLDSNSGEIFDLYDDIDESGLELPTLKARDVELEGILRYQSSGDIRSAMRLIEADGRDKLSPEANPLLSIASAYTMLNRQVRDNTVARSWNWLGRLERAVSPLPDVQIIMAALLVCRDWSGLSEKSKLANKVTRDTTACGLAFSSLLMGPPAFRFGFSLLSDAFALLAVSESFKGTRNARRAEKASSMLAWLSTRVDVAQPCTSISLW